MDVEKGMGDYALMSMGGVANLPSPDAHAGSIQDVLNGKKKKKKRPGWHEAMLESEGFQPEDDDEYLKMIPAWSPRELGIAGLASGSVATSVAALVIAGINPIIWVTAIFGIVLPPYSALQEQKITDIKAMRETNDAMEREMENLEYNNGRLKDQNEKLEASVGRCQDMKDILSDCQKMGSVSLGKLETQLQRSKTTLAQMEVNRKNDLIDTMFDIMLAVDDDQDFSLSDEEIDVMMDQLRDIMNVEIDREGFKKKIIGNGRDLDSIMLLIKDILHDDPEKTPLRGEKKLIRIKDSVDNE